MPQREFEVHSLKDRSEINMTIVTAVMNGTGGDKRYSLAYIAAISRHLREDTRDPRIYNVNLIVRYDEKSFYELKLLAESCKSLLIDARFNISLSPVAQIIDEITGYIFYKESDFSHDDMPDRKVLMIPDNYNSIIPVDKLSGIVQSTVDILEATKPWGFETWLTTLAPFINYFSNSESKLDTFAIIGHNHMMSAGEISEILKRSNCARRVVVRAPFKDLCLGSGRIALTPVPSDDFYIVPSDFNSGLLMPASTGTDQFDFMLTLVQNDEDKAFLEDCSEAIESGGFYICYMNYDKDSKHSFREYLSMIEQIEKKNLNPVVLIVVGCRTDTSRQLVEEATNQFRDMLQKNLELNITDMLPQPLFRYLLKHTRRIVGGTGEASFLETAAYYKKPVFYQCVNGTEQFINSIIETINTCDDPENPEEHRDLRNLFTFYFLQRAQRHPGTVCGLIEKIMSDASFLTNVFLEAEIYATKLKQSIDKGHETITSACRVLIHKEQTQDLHRFNSQDFIEKLISVKVSAEEEKVRKNIISEEEQKFKQCSTNFGKRKKTIEEKESNPLRIRAENISPRISIR